jgi:glutamate-1-semialdehyde 2,1-aminomutase
VQQTGRPINRHRIDSLLERERRTYASTHPASARAFGAATHLFGGVPMTWMNKWAGGFPLQLERANGNRVLDLDGHEYVDFALGDTGAMAGHSPRATVQAVRERIETRGGITTMLPTGDAERVGSELSSRFGLPVWSFTLSATDANRWALRLARLVTGRSKVLVFSHSYHGTVDEAFAVLGPDGGTLARPGNVGPPVPVGHTTRVAAWNDLGSVETALSHGDVAAVLTEPALTNIGIVLPQPGFLSGLHELATRYGALLILDETHTFSAGPGGMTAALGLSPDLLVVGKSIGGGIAGGAYGLSADVARRVEQQARSGAADLVDVGGVGGTLAGNALSLAAMRATLEQVLTPAAFAHMTVLGGRFAFGVQEVIDAYDVAWSVVQLGARAEYRFTSPAPRTGDESAAAADDQLDELMHLYTCNRGILMTPFHNMALMCPETTASDVDLHAEVFAAAVGELTGA